MPHPQREVHSSLRCSINRHRYAKWKLKLHEAALALTSSDALSSPFSPISLELLNAGHNPHGEKINELMGSTGPGSGTWWACIRPGSGLRGLAERASTAMGLSSAGPCRATGELERRARGRPSGEAPSGEQGAVCRQQRPDGHPPDGLHSVHLDWEGPRDSRARERPCSMVVSMEPLLPDCLGSGPASMASQLFSLWQSAYPLCASVFSAVKWDDGSSSKGFLCASVGRPGTAPGTVDVFIAQSDAGACWVCAGICHRRPLGCLPPTPPHQ